MELPVPSPLLSEQVLAARVEELAQEISEDLAGVDEVLLVGVLKGAFVFLSDLARRLTIPRRIDFMAAAHYDGATPTAEVELIMDLREDIRGKHVLLVEDILDTGATLAKLLALLGARGPASLKTCVLLSKRKPRPDGPVADYVGFEIDDEWVVGYGLDYSDRYRSLPFVGVIDPPDG